MLGNLNLQVKVKDDTKTTTMSTQSNLTINGKSLCHSVLRLSRPLFNPIDFTLGWFIAENPKKGSVECKVIWMAGSRESCKQLACCGMLSVGTTLVV